MEDNFPFFRSFFSEKVTKSSFKWKISPDSGKFLAFLQDFPGIEGNLHHLRQALLKKGKIALFQKIFPKIEKFSRNRVELFFLNSVSKVTKNLHLHVSKKPES
jgi:hypothetical protein